ncbi:uncharacterized protein LOC125672007 [Ostrea edulis]|uniref:uncharacterized protein LOC125672007 n=1 Tax=Ostrea edulis TaxID=37623 RepID=UPI002094E28E|nr:uncharacterized protein LOC125672007 [Ostrea edulis]
MEVPMMYQARHQTSPPSADSRFDTNRKRTAVDMMARDKLFQWTECRVWINSTIVTDIMETTNPADKSPFSTPVSERNAVTTFLRDPKKEKTGELLKQKYCESMVGLQGSAYFVFGLPRVKRIVKDVDEDLGKGSDQSESLDRLRETRNDRLQESTYLRESRNDQLGETRTEKLGNTKNDRVIEPQNNRIGESRNNGLRETLDDRRYLRESSRPDRENNPPDSFRSSNRRQDDYKPNPLGQSGAYDLSSSFREDLRESRKPRDPEESNLYSSRVVPDRQEPADDRGMYASRILPNRSPGELRKSRYNDPPSNRSPEELRKSRYNDPPSNRSPGELRKSRYNDPPSYAFGGIPDQQPSPREQYNDIQSWLPYGQSPKPSRSREDYPLPNPPPHREASGRYTGVIRR